MKANSFQPFKLGNALYSLVFLLFFSLIILLPATAFSADETEVKDIKVKGNQRIESDTVVSFLGISKGDKISSEDIDKALSNIYSTGLFADISIDNNDGVLEVNVIENPIISEVAFEGNKKIDDKSLKQEIKLAPRSVYTKSDLQNDVQRILDLYKKSGRFSASINPKVIELEQNRINLVFEIDEGDKSKIAKINFIGNEVFSSDKLKRTIQTRESRWYRFLSSDDLYDQDRLEFDKELLRRLYTANGYADFKITNVSAELSSENNQFYITFTMDEGQLYKFGEMSVENQVGEVGGDTLKGLLKSKSGEVFDTNTIDDSIEEITRFLGNLGYAFVNIEPQYKRDPGKQIIAVNYLVKEGPRVYVEHIKIKGNVRTLDEVIRREFRLAEGDPYNAAKLKRSHERLRNLGFFKNVEVKNIPGSAPDKVDIEVAVEEQSTGELTFGAGYSTSDGALGDISISERNLLGKGQFLKLNFTLASARQEVDFSFTEPYFLDRNVAAGFDLFNTKIDGGSLNNASYDREATGGTIRATYPLTEHLSHAVRYSYRTDNITDIDPAASLFVQQQAGERITSLVGHSIIWDTRDNRFDPTTGYNIRFNQDFAGVGGDAQFVRNEIRTSYYQPIIRKKDIILKLAANTGHIVGYGGEDVRINDRFFIGGRDLRGFDNSGIGPRDQVTNDALGGNIYGTGTVELAFPVGLPEELGVSGSVFSDFGTLFELDDTSSGSNIILDESSPRVSVGAGLSWNSPLGPIRVDLAEAVVKEDFDETEIFRFSFGTRF